MAMHSTYSKRILSIMALVMCSSVSVTASFSSSSISLCGTTASIKSRVVMGLSSPPPSYVPDGFTKEEWELQKSIDGLKRRRHSDNFKSRVFVDCQHDLEKFQQQHNQEHTSTSKRFQSSSPNFHLFPMMNAEQELKLHHIEAEDVPCMQCKHGTCKNLDIPSLYVPQNMSKQKRSAVLLLMIGLYGIGFSLTPN